MKIVGISIGDCQADMERRGYRSEHLDIFATRLVRKVIHWGYGVGYGGVLRSGGFVFQNEGFLRIITHAVQAEFAEMDETAVSSGQLSARTARLFSFQPWPVCDELKTSDVAEHLDMVRYFKIRPTEDSDRKAFSDWYGGLKSGQMKDDVKNAAMAVSLSRMRAAMMTGMADIDGQPVDGCQARIVIGGKASGWLGRLPGIAEEALQTIKAKKPLYLVGAYGGIVGRICRFLKSEKTGWEELNFLSHEKDASFASVLRGNAHVFEALGLAEFHQDRARAGFEEMIDIFKQVQGDWGLLNNGLDEDDNRKLMESENVLQICHLVKKGLDKLQFVNSG